MRKEAIWIDLLVAILDALSITKLSACLGDYSLRDLVGLEFWLTAELYPEN